MCCERHTLALGIVLAVAAAGCASAAARIEKVNRAMRKTPFSAVGTTTTFGHGGLQYIVWNPAQGLHIR